MSSCPNGRSSVPWSLKCLINNGKEYQKQDFVLLHRAKSCFVTARLGERFRKKGVHMGRMPHMHTFFAEFSTAQAEA